MYSDFSAIPFRIFHSWFQRDDFDKMVEGTWKNLYMTDNNRLIRLKKKLQLLKMLDQGCVNMEILDQRTDLMKSLNDINSLETMEAAQKAKVRWAIEGDENTKYFHGPDGYTFEFVRGYWRMMDIDILEALKCFLVDFEKAYDSVRWDYLDDILHNFGFGEKWRMWIKGCLSSSTGLHISFSRVMQAGFFAGVSIVHVLKCFFLASGLKINVSKSKLMGIGVGTGVVERAANVVGCSTLSTPFTYLGVKVGDCMSRSQSWDDVIRKISYIQAFHDIRGSFDCSRRNMYRKSLWMDIIKKFDILKRKGIDLMSFCIKKVGNGVDTLFWEYVWMGDLSLKCKFLRLYALETCKHVSITVKLSFDSIASSFRRVPRGGIESEQYEDLVNCLATIHLAQMKDRSAWTLTGDGDFSVKSVQNLLDDSL
ncbi:hypothetical protein Tco_1031039 [Tanacetum coccineum]|uniref:RNA-directed DNA polymerase, eukaryota, reverse transcriptase zinc-binding domain protein n=1 Tax=Tanacetum coccineum TaxID=301880 RepID=A0ABQ5G9K6_9ASTR